MRIRDTTGAATGTDARLEVWPPTTTVMSAEVVPVTSLTVSCKERWATCERVEEKDVEWVAGGRRTSCM
jgi:hypothetical protein